MRMTQLVGPLAAAALIALSGTAMAQGSGTRSNPDTHRGPAQEGGRTQATPGPSGSGGAVVDTTGTVTPRSGTAPGPDTHKGPAQEGGRTQATPGPSR
ncbi:hypothetical protein V5F49_00090 [Xanthobacter sp. V3C-3]|uniref:hypothetical protein n=1 Tax=Xanthobacter lutulentifluminis TaxID=3119935 RepID=UPI0037280D41